MHLSQIRTAGGGIAVVAREGTEAAVVRGASSVRELALEALEAGQSLAQAVAARGLGEAVDLARLLEDGRVLSPIHHPDPAHLHVTGTGLTHLGSAATRDAMHQKARAEDATDSLRMFRMGLEGGKPERLPGVQPEWFYKGDGSMIVAPGAPLLSPAFAEDAGEEPEIAGIYVIAPDGTPARVGWALGNEFSDHATERVNYLWLAHSKLRPASFGPEIYREFSAPYHARVFREFGCGGLHNCGPNPCHVAYFEHEFSPRSLDLASPYSDEDLPRLRESVKGRGFIYLYWDGERDPVEWYRSLMETMAPDVLVVPIVMLTPDRDPAEICRQMRPISLEYARRMEWGWSRLPGARG